ncbi:hypothetical protein ACJX0J_005475, partial [Zea mays]
DCFQTYVRGTLIFYNLNLMWGTAVGRDRSTSSLLATAAAAICSNRTSIIVIHKNKILYKSDQTFSWPISLKSSSAVPITHIRDL